MNILVCVKQVPDTTEIRMDPKTNTLIRTGVPSTVNPFDKNALEAAVQLKEQLGGTVTVISMGPPQAVDALRDCMALGADRMVLATDRAFGGADTYATSYVLAQAAKHLGGFDLIICGRQAIDGDTAQVGPMIAEHLGLPQISCVSKIEIEGDTLIASQERENSYAKLQTKLPALVSVTKSINEPRLPNIMKKLKANRMEPEIINAESLEDLDESKIGLKGSPTKVSKIFVPNREKHTVYIEGKNPADSAAKLIEALEEAKIQFIGGAGV